MEEMTEIEAICERLYVALYEIKMHICHGRFFEGGVGLGELMQAIDNRQVQEMEKRKKNE